MGVAYIGIHVSLGAIMLTAILFRCVSDHFKTEYNFSFEAAARCGHIIDVVWLGLFIFVYWL